LAQISKATKIARGATYLFIQSLLANVIGVLYFMVLARFFPVVSPDVGSPKMGAFQFMNFIVVLSNVLGALALPSAAAKFIPQYLAKNEKAKANGVAVRHFQVAFATGLAAAVTVFLFSDFIATSFFSNSPWIPVEQMSLLLKILSLSCFLTNFMSFLSGTLQGLQKIGELALMNLTFNVLQSFLVVALLFCGFDLFSPVIGWVVGMAAASIVGTAIVLKSFSLRGKPHPLKPLLSFSTRYAVAIGFPMVVGISLIAQPSLVLFAGASYKIMTPYLVILAFSTIPTIMGVAIRPILLTLEKSRTVSAITITSIAAEALTCFLAIVVLGWGVFGATLGRTFAAALSFSLGIYVLRKHIHVKFDKEVLWKTLASCGVMAAALLLFDILRMQLTGSTEFLVFRLHLLPVYILLGALVYAGTLFTLKAVKREDLELLKEYLPRKLRWTVSWIEKIFPVG